MGATKRPAYRVIAIDKRRSRDGRALEILGYYDPLTEPATVQLDTGRIQAWMSNGAQPSDTVVKLMRQAERAATAGAQPEKPKRATRTTKARPSKKAQAKAAAAEAPDAADAVDVAEPADAGETAATETSEATPEPLDATEAEIAEPATEVAAAEQGATAEETTKADG